MDLKDTNHIIMENQNPTPDNDLNQTPHTQPNRIKALPQEVINRIAAGEVVQRPASVAKELIENSLDAQSTQIDISSSHGGLRLLTVTDDGVGIHPEDLPLAATRFATSKLSKFDDLKSIQTFGFRGEALASASMVSHLTITSRKRKLSTYTTTTNSTKEQSKYSSQCAYKMMYQDGKPTTDTPSPTAGKEGTIIQVADLFYNIQARRLAFTSGSSSSSSVSSSRKEMEEYQKILSIAQRYAIHSARDGVGIICRKKGGSGSTDLNTASLAHVRQLMNERRKRQFDDVNRNDSGASIKDDDDDDNDDDISMKSNKIREAATKEVIGHIFGLDLIKELLTFESKEGDVDQVSLAALKALQKDYPSYNDLENSSQSKDKLDKVSSLQTTKSIDWNYFGESIPIDNTHDMGTILAKESEQQQQLDKQSNQSSSSSHYSFAYEAYGFITNTSYSVPKSSSAFILFINNRLVESPPLRRAMEGIYNDTSPKGSKPFIYLSLKLPGPHLDVNIHPTKNEVAFLHDEQLCNAIALATKELLATSQNSRTFYTQTLLPSSFGENSKSLSSIARGYDGKRSNDGELHSSVGKSESDDEESDENVESQDVDYDSKTARKRSKVEKVGKGNSTNNKRTYDPKNLVRTSSVTQQGALEPYLIPTQSQNLTHGEDQRDGEGFKTTTSLGLESNPTLASLNTESFPHKPDCKYASNSTQAMIDMNIPGAFASNICRCQIQQANALPPTLSSDSTLMMTTQTAVVRPKKITPTECGYTSIEELRKDITSKAHRELTNTLRESVFVGCISRHRSLIQSGVELLIVNHSELARELFYQLALTRFGGFETACIGGGGVIVKVLVEQALQLEEATASSKSANIESRQIGKIAIDEVNSTLAEQATQCLMDHAPMLGEYFSIRFEMKEHPENSKKEKVFMLTGLPVLLDGHSPPPHGLPLFLIRLATEINYKEEKDCFEGICTELGSYYSEIPLSLEAQSNGTKGSIYSSSSGSSQSQPLIDEQGKRFIQHTLFPALKFFLVPHQIFSSDGTFSKLALLPKLHKIFERC
jgi:DNA mismatch repair protein MutL